MAEQAPRREVRLSRAALEALQEIWIWNAERNGARLADGYSNFGGQGLQLMPEIEGVSDVQLLETILDQAVSSNSIEPIRLLLQRQS